MKHPAFREPLALSGAEARLLRLLLHGDPASGASAWTTYSGSVAPSTDAARLRRLRSMEVTGAVEVVVGEAMGWGSSMWGARLTCIGVNALYRFDGSSAAAVHSDCAIEPGTATWAPDGVCSACRTPRPFDHAAWLDYLRVLPATERIAQEGAPRLYCVEHGWVRRGDVRSDKVCRRPATTFHDGGLDRV